MFHYFFTNLACRWTQLDDVGVRTKLNRDRRRELGRGVPPTRFVRSPEETAKSIQLWLDSASRFYERQTKAEEFRVLLRYHEDYEHVVRSFRLPAWADLTTDSPDVWLRANVCAGVACTMTRVDSDDSYAVDLFEYLSTVRPCTNAGQTLVLYRILRQFDVTTGQMSCPLVYRRALGFATVLTSSFRSSMDLTGVVGDHLTYIERPHRVPDLDFALQRITSRNACNTWGPRAWLRPLSGAFRAERSDRYVGCGEHDESAT